MPIIECDVDYCLYNRDGVCGAEMVKISKTDLHAEHPSCITMDYS